MAATSYTHNPYVQCVLQAAEKGADDELTDFGRMGVPLTSGLSDSDRESCNTTPDASAVCDAPDVEEGMTRQSSSKFYDALSPSLPFYEYGTMGNWMLREEVEERGLPRLFVGQVPYQLGPCHVAWLIFLLTGRRVCLVEKIVRWTQNKRACGCFHVYCFPQDIDGILLADQSALCEEFGVWVARNAAEQRVLVDHCEYLRTHKEERAPLMPYQLMTVQRATSNYQRPHFRTSTA